MKTKTKQLALVPTLLAALFFVMAQTAFGDEYERNIEKKFDVDKNATLEIQNKFGEVHCLVWNEQAVSVKVVITVDASNKDKADKIFDKIDVTLTGDRSKVTGITKIGNMSFNHAEFSIDYTIMMPKSINIDLTNRFGELYVGEVDGSAKIDLEYGEYEIEALNSENTNIRLRFSNGSVEYMKGGKIDMEYGGVEAEGANNLDIRSRFSEVSIDKMESLTLDSQYDDISIDQCGSLNLTSRFSDVNIDGLKGNFKLDSQYGGVDIDRIYAGFTSGSIDASFADISLGFEPGASFQVSAEMKFCELSYPSSNSSIRHTEENYVTNIYQGVIGSNKATSAKLTIDSQNGDVDISF